MWKVLNNASSILLVHLRVWFHLNLGAHHGNRHVIYFNVFNLHALQVLSCCLLFVSHNFLRKRIIIKFFFRTLRWIDKLGQHGCHVVRFYYVWRICNQSGDSLLGLFFHRIFQKVLIRFPIVGLNNVKPWKCGVRIMSIFSGSILHLALHSLKFRLNGSAA